MKAGELLICTSLTITATWMPSLCQDVEDEGREIREERSVDTCQENITEPIYTINSKYCKCCRPGFYKIADCANSGEEASCLPCSNGQYSSTYNQALRCSPCKSPAFCSKENVEIYEGCTRISNIKCRCKDGYYFRKRFGSVDDGDCMEHTKCSPGKYIFKKGTREADTVCHQCPNGTFSTSDNNMICQNCSVCDSTSVGTVPQQCTPTTDTKCNPWHQVSSDKDTLITIVVPTCVGTLVVAAISIFVICVICKKKDGCMKLRHFLRLAHGDDSNGGSDIALKLQNQHTAENGHASRTTDSGNDSTTTNAPFIPQIGCTQTTSEEEGGHNVPKLAESPVDGRFKYLPLQNGNTLDVPVPTLDTTQNSSHQNDEISKREQERTAKEKLWEQCLLYLSQHVVKEWKLVIRALYADTKCTSRPGNVIIQEVEANNPNNVTEQFYQALKKWYTLMEPKKLDLMCVLKAVEECNLMDIKEHLQKEFSSLILGRQSPGDIVPERTEFDEDSTALLTEASSLRNS